ncbi:hypothetical protein BDV12DRAFT_199410 [Aspergillus spectabilis]
MRFAPILFLASYPGVILADYTTVLADINTITTHLTTLTNSVNAITTPGIPALPFALQVQVDATTLSKQIVTSAANANASQAFGFGSLQVGLALIGLQPKITSSLNLIVRKEEVFGEFGVIVLASLVQLQRDTRGFAGQIVPKLGALEAALAPGIVEGIEEAFEEAVGAYQGHVEMSTDKRWRG